jgi:hypothetical protein
VRKTPVIDFYIGYDSDYWMLCQSKYGFESSQHITGVTAPTDQDDAQATTLHPAAGPKADYGQIRPI